MVLFRLLTFIRNYKAKHGEVKPKVKYAVERDAKILMHDMLDSVNEEILLSLEPGANSVSDMQVQDRKFTILFYSDQTPNTFLHWYADVHFSLSSMNVSLDQLDENTVKSAQPKTGKNKQVLLFKHQEEQKDHGKNIFLPDDDDPKKLFIPDTDDEIQGVMLDVMRR